MTAGSGKPYPSYASDRSHKSYSPPSVRENSVKSE